MNKLMMIGSCAVAGMLVSGCVSSGLTAEEKENPATVIWYDNASLLVEANDPDLRAGCQIGVPALDAVVDSVKDIVISIPEWTITRVEEKHFNNMYLESAKAINSGDEDSKLVVKGEAFKTALLMDTFAGEVAHVKAAEALPKDQRKENYAQNEDVYKAAQGKVEEYLHNQVFPFNTTADNAAREAFFADPARQGWNAKTDEIVAKLMACVVKSSDEAAAKAAMAKLSAEMGVQKMDWAAVLTRLNQNLEQIQKAIQDLATALQDPTLQQSIAKAAFGGEIVPGKSGEETLNTISRFSKQLAVSGKLIAWLISDLAKN